MLHRLALLSTVVIGFIFGQAFAAFPEEPQFGRDMDAQLMFEIVTSEFVYTLGNKGDAYKIYMEQAKRHRLAWGASRAFNIALEAKARKEMLQAAERWASVASSKDINAKAALCIAKVFNGTPLSKLKKDITTVKKALKSNQLDEFAAHLANGAFSQQNKAENFKTLNELIPSSNYGKYAALPVGKLASAIGQNDIALRYASTAYQNNPDDSEAARFYATLLYIAGDKKKGFQILESGLSANPQDPDLRYLLARSYLSEKQIDLALKTAKPLEPLVYEIPFIAGTIAEIYRAAGQNAEAKSFLEIFLSDKRLAKNDPRLFNQALFLLGRIETEGQQYEEANRHFLAVTSDSDLYVLARFQYAENLYALKDYGKVRQFLHKAVKDYPQNADFLILLARVDAALGNDKAAKATLDKTLALPKLTAHDYYWCAIVASEAKLHDFSEQILRKAITLYPENPTLCNALGYNLLERGVRFAEAKQLIEAALKKEPANPMYIDSYGWYFFLVKDYEQAFKLLDRAWRDAPQEAEIGLHFAKACLATGDKAQAQKTLDTVLKIKPDYDEAKILLREIRESRP
ncbi:MAG TPA: hypothetical protein DCW60_03530 [Sutterella sp.]|nr:hypothetical protein [Sutterella sp.]